MSLVEAGYLIKVEITLFDSLKRFYKELVLAHKDALSERVRGVAGEYRYPALSDNRAVIESLDPGTERQSGRDRISRPQGGSSPQ